MSVLNAANSDCPRIAANLLDYKHGLESVRRASSRELRANRLFRIFCRLLILPANETASSNSAGFLRQQRKVLIFPKCSFTGTRLLT
jgi:hypothetical protein